MNIQSTGNSLHLAPDAHPGDGLLNLIRVNGQHPDSLAAYATALLRGQFDTLPSVQEDVAATFTLHATGQHVGQVFHVDGETRTPPGGPVHVQVWARCTSSGPTEAVPGGYPSARPSRSARMAAASSSISAGSSAKLPAKSEATAAGTRTRVRPFSTRYSAPSVLSAPISMNITRANALRRSVSRVPSSPGRRRPTTAVNTSISSNDANRRNRAGEGRA